MHNKKMLNDIINELYDCGGLKFGNFIMKSGRNSPVYIDLRVLVTYPKLLESVGLYMWEEVGSKLKCNSLCGVPYNALPIATVIAVKHNIPMLIKRKEIKRYGTKKLIEGKIEEGDNCVIIEDVVTTGSSIVETVEILRKEGLNITDAIVFVNREQGANEILKHSGIKLHSICTLPQIMSILKESGKINNTMVETVSNYLSGNQAAPPDMTFGEQRLKLKYEERALKSNCKIGSDLLKLISRKQSNLCVAVDVTNAKDLIDITNRIGPYICLLKTHADIIMNFTPQVANDLIELAKKHDFMILEDRKFADIGNTVGLQYSSGYLDISRWADFVTVHSLPGEGILKAIEKQMSIIDDANRGCFLLAEMSSEGNLITSEYANATVAMAKSWSKIVAGLVCQTPLLIDNPEFIQLTPGVRRNTEAGGDGMGQQWVSPEEAIINKGADIVVVGRGITSDIDNIEKEAKLYQHELWNAYLQRIK